MKRYFVWGMVTSLCLLTSYARSEDFTLKIDHYAILVANLDISANFYAQALGLQEIANQNRKPEIRWFGLGDGRELHLINRSKEGNSLRKDVHLALAIDNLDAVMKRLDGLEIHYESWQGVKNTKNARSDGVEQIYLQDPDGYWIEVNTMKR